jgi:hypothetical protein
VPSLILLSNYLNNSHINHIISAVYIDNYYLLASKPQKAQATINLIAPYKSNMLKMNQGSAHQI